MRNRIRSIAILAAGAWGCTLADMLSRSGVGVRLWDPSAETIHWLRESHRPRHMQEVDLHHEIRLTTDLAEALAGCDAAAIVAPSQAIDGLCAQIAGLGPGAHPRVFVLASKGIDIPSRRLLADVVLAHLDVSVAVLSGPCIAREVARRVPTSAVVACPDEAAGAALQAVFSTPWLRIYRQSDIRGVELGGALKNVIAIGAGASDGLGFGDNSKSALLCRGLAEMTRLSVALGADARTLAGLAGLGDLAVTCFSPYSRNRKFGELLAKGRTPAAAAEEVGQVVEGMPTAEAALDLARRAGVDTPIIRVVHQMCREAITPLEALESLMTRGLKSEF